MSILDRITELLGNREQRELTNYLGIKSVAFSEWKSGKSKSYRKYLIEIANFFDVSLDYLVYGKENTSSTIELKADERELLGIYNRLSEMSKGKLMERATVLSELETPVTKEPEPEQEPTIQIKHSYYRVSAGTGFDLPEGDNWEMIDIPDTPEARKADFAITIKGNSMEPVYFDGDIVLVKQQPAVELGEIGIFNIEDNGYIKKFGGDRLISLNDAYDDIILSEYDEDRNHCLGKVIGRV